MNPRVECSGRPAHVLLDGLRDHTDIIDDVLPFQLAGFDRLDHGFRSGLQGQSGVAITGNTILLGELALRLDKRFTGASDRREELFRIRSYGSAKVRPEHPHI